MSAEQQPASTHGANGSAPASPPAARHGAGRPRGGDTPRVCVAYTFYRVRPEALALPAEERERLAAEFEAAVEEAADELGILRTYSTVGMRADADILFWQAAETADGLQRFAARLRRAKLFRYLEMPHHFFAMTRRSMYVDNHTHEGQDGRRTHVQPADSKYLFVYPFVKTRAWYALSMEERQRMMDEHIASGHRYPTIKINTTYSFGLDDQEFVVAFEGDSPSKFLDLVMELRSSGASAYTLRDTPSFTAIAQSLRSTLAIALGIEEAEPAPEELRLAAAAV